MVSPLESAITFFKDFGLFSVVLPFLLVFTITFAILEKTKILGTEKIKGEEYTRKQLNIMVAFVFGMLVVAANSVVTAINKALPNVVLLIVIIISFLMLIGTFYKTGEMDFAKTHDRWTAFFVFIIFIAIVLIFANSIQKTPSQSYLEYIVDYVVNNASGTVVTSIIFLLVAIGAVVYVTKAGDKK